MDDIFHTLHLQGQYIHSIVSCGWYIFTEPLYTGLIINMLDIISYDEIHMLKVN